MASLVEQNIGNLRLLGEIQFPGQKNDGTEQSVGQGGANMVTLTDGDGAQLWELGADLLQARSIQRECGPKSPDAPQVCEQKYCRKGQHSGQIDDGQPGDLRSRDRYSLHGGRQVYLGPEGSGTGSC